MHPDLSPEGRDAIRDFDAALFLIHQPRSAELLHSQVDPDFDMVLNPHEWDAFVHSIFLAIEDQHSLNFIFAGLLGGDRQLQFLLLGDSTDGKIPVDVKCGRAGLDHLRRVKRDFWIMLDIEKILPLQLVILHAASRIHGGRVDRD